MSSGPPGNGGPATLARLSRPAGVTVDPFGNVYFVEQYWVRRIDGKTGIITTVAPQLGSITGSSGDGGPYANAFFATASALGTDNNGNLYIADRQHLRKIDFSTGIISTIAGSGQRDYASDGPALNANLASMTAVVVDKAGNIWIADNGNTRLFVIAISSGILKSIAGTSPNGDGGRALGALLPNLVGLAVNAEGDLFFLAGGIRRVDRATGIISTVSTGQTDPALGTPGNGPASIALDSRGNIFVTLQTTVERIDAVTGAITTVAGNGAGQYGGGPLGDGGPATKAQVTPVSVAVDSSGNLYISDYWNNRIRRVDAATEIITTIAGNGGASFNGLGGNASRISIGTPGSIAIAPNGDIYWAASGWVLRMNSAGILSVAAGNGGGCIDAGDGGGALSALLCGPTALAFDQSGNLFLSTSGRVRRIDAQTGIIQTVAGTGIPGVSDDGITATSAALNPAELAFLGTTLYFVDAPFLGGPLAGAQGRIRSVNPATPPPLPQPPSITRVTNAVDYRPEFAPGSVVSIFGNYLGPQLSAVGQTGTDGLVPTTLGGDQVTFNGIPGPLLYVSPGQINGVVPFSLKPGTMSVQVNTSAGTNIASGLAVSQTALSLYGGIVFNPDGTLNGASHPAPKGATLVMYGTGLGQTTPASVDGSIVRGPPFPMPVTPFTATIMNGPLQYKAALPYIGPLPEFIAGAVQVNVQIPGGVPAGVSSLVIAPTNGTVESLAQSIYMFSDPPVLTGISPTSPIPQTVGSLTQLILTGQNITTIRSFNFAPSGRTVNIPRQEYYSCTDASCSVLLDFAGIAGQYVVTVTNVAGQISNGLTFSVQSYGPPTIAGVTNSTGSGPVSAKKGPQIIEVLGTNFVAPETADVYYQGAKIATLSSSSLLQIQISGPDLLQLFLDLQGNTGQYSVEVTGTNGSSGLFSFTATAP